MHATGRRNNCIYTWRGEGVQNVTNTCLRARLFYMPLAPSKRRILHKKHGRCVRSAGHFNSEAIYCAVLRSRVHSVHGVRRVEHKEQTVCGPRRPPSPPRRVALRVLQYKSSSVDARVLKATASDLNLEASARNVAGHTEIKSIYCCTTGTAQRPE